MNKSKILSFLLCFCLLFEQTGLAQVAGSLDISSHIAAFRNSLVQDKFRPLHLRYLDYDAKSNNFKLLLDKGDFVGADLSVRPFNRQAQGYDNGVAQRPSPADDKIEQETKKVMEYFFIGITLPNESFWVNLRPRHKALAGEADSEDNIIDSELAKTDIGKIMLEADVQLKKDTALYTSPQTTEGKKYWDKLYKKAEELYGYDNITIPTLTRPWIVPGEIIIRETPDNAYIYKATLKVMLEEDYIKNSQFASVSNQQYEFKDPRSKELNTYSTQLIKELIIPKLTKDINTSKRYSALRQVYYSLILAQWFKQEQTQSHLVGGFGINSGNLTGLTSKISWSKETYYKEYQKSFTDGEYSLKEPVHTPYGQTIRSYFSGGVGFGPRIFDAVSSGIIKGNPKLDSDQVFVPGKYIMFHLNLRLPRHSSGQNGWDCENCLNTAGKVIPPRRDFLDDIGDIKFGGLLELE